MIKLNPDYIQLNKINLNCLLNKIKHIYKCKNTLELEMIKLSIKQHNNAQSCKNFNHIVMQDE